MSDPGKEAIERVAARLEGAERLLFLTGAGLSADSGLPTYRGVGGLYEGVETPDGRAIEEILSGPTMQRDPGLCWRYIMEIEKASRGALPNEGHRVIAGLESRFHVVVLTQNVDGLHRAAGSTDVIDIHGDVRELACTGCEHRRTVADFAALDCPPRCPRCEAVVRPDVVLFGEMLPMDKVGRLSSELERGFDAVFSVGTSSLFPYIAEPVLRARMGRALTIEINPAETAVSDVVEERIPTPASRALSSLATELVRRSVL